MCQHHTPQRCLYRRSKKVKVQTHTSAESEYALTSIDTRSSYMPCSLHTRACRRSNFHRHRRRNRDLWKPVIHQHPFDPDSLLHCGPIEPGHPLRLLRSKRFSFFQTPNISTLNIPGIGTFQMDLGINSALEGGEIFEDDDVGDLGLLFDLTIPDFQHSVGPLTQTIGYTDPGLNCVPDFHTPCPPYFFTGSFANPPIYVTSLGGTWTQEMIVNSAATPEPSTFLLLTTGLLGIGGIVRRRFLLS